MKTHSHTLMCTIGRKTRPVCSIATDVMTAENIGKRFDQIEAGFVFKALEQGTTPPTFSYKVIDVTPPTTPEIEEAGTTNKPGSNKSDKTGDKK